MRFGVLGTADIARTKLAPAILNSGHEVTAVASRDPDRAAAFASDLGIPESYGSYEGVLDADVDAVYNPLPNALHGEWIRRAADAGLPTLCEKPLALDPAEAAALFDYCEDAGVTLMEAFMYGLHPRTMRAREVVRTELGPLRSAEATFTFPLAGGGFRLSPELGGGALLDLGGYAVSAVRNFLGEPDAVTAHTIDARDSGVDTDVRATLEYPGAHAAVRGGFDTPRHERYRVDAENGYLEATRAFSEGTAGKPPAIEYGIDGREVVETFPPTDHYRLEVEAFVDAVESGAPPVIDREETVANLRVLDAIRERADRGERIAVGE